jgi:hypothetical protein
MKKLLTLSVLLLSGMALNAVAQQSVADAARKAAASRKADPNKKVIDNDSVPAMIEASPDNSMPAMEPSKAAKDESKAAAPAKAADGKDDVSKDAGKDKEPKLSAADEQKKSADAWKKKVEEQKKEVALLQRELEVSEREARLRAAAYYADAGVQLRDQEKFASDSRKQQTEIDTKKQSLADAQKKLEDMQEQARKAGVPSGQVE